MKEYDLIMVSMTLSNGVGSLRSKALYDYLSLKGLKVCVVEKESTNLLWIFSIIKKYIQGRYFDNAFQGYKIALRSIWLKNILRLGVPHRFPTSLNCYISNSDNIIFHPDDINNFQSPGTYYQNFKAKVYIGKGSYIGPNVGIITANHIIGDLDNHEDGKDVIIGEKCWVGMNCVILPGVELGDNIVVAAGSVVNRSFLEGSVIIAGTPAKIIKCL